MGKNTLIVLYKLFHSIIVGSDITLLGEARESGLAQNCQAQNNWWRECLKGEHSVLSYLDQSDPGCLHVTHSRFYLFA